MNAVEGILRLKKNKKNNTNSILLLELQLFDTLQEALFGTVKVGGQACDCNVI